MSDFTSQQLFSNKQLRNATLLLIGRSGNGKSSTGNSILGEKRFKTKSGSSASTTNCQVETTNIRASECTVTVIDTPDMFRSEESRKEVETYLRKGFHAILIILTLMRRASRREISEYQSLQTIFGKSVIGYMIVVFTGGDSLEDSNETLQDYTGPECPKFIKDFLQSCSNRVVLFNNKTEDKQKKDEQVCELFKFVKEVLDASNGNPFTSAIFEVLDHENEVKVQNPLEVSEQQENRLVMMLPEQIPTLKVDGQCNRKPSISKNSRPEEAKTVSQTSDSSNLVFVPQKLYRNMVKMYSFTLIAGLVREESPILTKPSIFSEMSKIQSYDEIYESLRVTWSNIKNLTFLTGRNGLFLIKLHNELDMDYIMNRRPLGTWRVRDYKLVMKRWTPATGWHLNKYSGDKVWIRLPHLPVELWNMEFCTMIASCLRSNLLGVDNRSIASPRICIELPTEHQHIKELVIAIENSHIFKQAVVYEAITEHDQVIVGLDRPDNGFNLKMECNWISCGIHYLVIKEALYDEMIARWQWALIARLSSVDDHETRAEWDAFLKEIKTMSNDEKLFLSERIKALFPQKIASFWIERNDLFILRFENERDMNRVLEFGEAGALNLGGRTLILKKLEPNTAVEWHPSNAGKFVWLRLPDLPVELWTLDVFWGIADRVKGRLTELDSRTKGLLGLKFARIRIEIISNSFEQIDEIEMEIEDGFVFLQKIVYEEIVEDYMEGVGSVDTNGGVKALETKIEGHNYRLFVRKGRFEKMGRAFSYSSLAGPRGNPGIFRWIHPNDTKSVWLRFPDLPVELWEVFVFSGIASFLKAKLLAVDPDTEQKLHLRFARICVEVSLMKFELIREVEIAVEGSRVFRQVIVYELLMSATNTSSIDFFDGFRY